jgi:membrane-bound serine protease (ClpP class)
MAKYLSALLTAAMLALLPCAVSAQNAPAAGIAVVLDITGGIGPATAEYVHNGLAEAEKHHAKVIVLRMDTPGGLSSSMRAIIHDILTSPIPVIGYVAPAGARAASAGTYIMYASHLAAMAPSTHLGAATPVQIGGGGLFGGGNEKTDNNKNATAPTTTEQAKVLNDAIAYIRSLAQLRGRNAQWAEQAVREAATLTASEAKDKHVVDLTADNIPDLLRKADGRTVKVDDHDVTLRTAGLKTITFEPNWRSRFLNVITNPNIAYLLLLAGIYGIMFEFFSPGGYFPGVLGGISLLIGLYALNLLPVNYAGVGLLLLGMVMMTAEAFVPSFGALGLGGITAFVIGSLFLFDTDVPGFQLSWGVIATAALVSVAFLAIALAAVIRAHRRTVAIGDSALVGREAQVLNWDGEEGDVQVLGERWRARANADIGAKLAPGQRVRVIARRDLLLLIEPEPTGSSKP